MPSERKLWLLRDSGEIYALCSLCVMHRHLEFYVDYDAPAEEIADVVELQGGRCRAEIEDYPSCLSRPAPEADPVGEAEADGPEAGGCDPTGKE